VALALVLDTWLAALIVGAALLVVGGLLALMGRARMKQVSPPVPERALRSVRQDIGAVQEGVQAGREHQEEGVRNGA
jgi:putative superfamily III holin-X